MTRQLLPACRDRGRFRTSLRNSMYTQAKAIQITYQAIGQPVDSSGHPFHHLEAGAQKQQYALLMPPAHGVCFGWNTLAWQVCCVSQLHRVRTHCSPLSRRSTPDSCMHCRAEQEHLDALWTYCKKRLHFKNELHITTVCTLVSLLRGIVQQHHTFH